MLRRWQVPPDESGTMSREALIGALIDAAALLDIAGGGLTVLVGRERTNLPGEMVMTGAVLEWRDRTDAKAQPEAPSTATVEEDAGIPETAHAGHGDLHKPRPEDPNGFKYGPTAENPDGFKYETLQAEDVEEPEPVR